MLKDKGDCACPLCGSVLRDGSDAQGMVATYKGQQLGMIGDIGCYSFHETKNYSMGEDGAVLLKNGAMLETAEIIREKGTNRSKFFGGQIEKYTWVEATCQVN